MREPPRPHRAIIATEFDASVSLAERHRTEMVIVQRAEAPSIRRLILYIGSAIPMHTTSLGCACLAAMGEDERAGLSRELLKAAGNDASSVQRDIEEALAQYREHGFVLNLGRTHPDINAVGVPVVSRDAKRVMALTCGANRLHTPVEKLKGPMGKALQELAYRIAPMLDGDAPVMRGA